MTTVTLTIPGKPFAWRRARSNGGVRFKDKATKDHEATVEALAVPLFPVPLEGPLRVDIRASFAVPKSWSKKRTAETLWRPHASRPDCDNLAKQIGDALNRIAWVDDAQVAELSIRKVWGDRDQTVVIVETM